MDSPTSTPRPPLAHQLSSVPSTPLSSAPPSPKQAFFGYRDERAHLTVSMRARADSQGPASMY